MQGKRYGIEVVHRRGGKTVKAIILLIDRALRFKGERGRYAYLAPLRTQAKGIAWDYLKNFATKIPGTQVNESEMWVELPNHARIRLYGADNPDSLRGIYLDGVVLDEVAQMKPEVWGEIVQPTLADRQGWALFIGTPKGINLFSELFYKAQANPDWYSGVWTVNDTDALPASEIETLKAEMSDAQFRQEMLCDFSASSDDALIPMNLVEEAVKRAPDAHQWEFAPRVLGVDIARYGGDRSVIQRRQGLMSWEPKVWQGVDTMTMAGHVAYEIKLFKPDAVFIDASPASYGVIDRLRSLHHNPIEVNFGGSPDAEKYSNKRSEMWHRVRLWLDQGGALPNNVSLKIDLCAPLYTYANAAGKFALESKDKIKERINVSPDLGDALALTFAFDVAPGRHRLSDGTVIEGLLGDDNYLPRESEPGIYNPLA